LSLFQACNENNKMCDLSRLYGLALQTFRHIFKVKDVFGGNSNMFMHTLMFMKRMFMFRKILSEVLYGE